MRVVVVGAGPAGLAAALGATRRGHQVTVFERDTVGAALRRWGPTRLFSPTPTNLPPGAAGFLPALPDLLTGPEFVDRVLMPLAEGPLGGRVHVGQRVVAIGRAGWTRADHAGHPLRAERPFRVLVHGPDGERIVEADAVLDAGGVDLPLPFGVGGLPAIGERALGGVIRELGALTVAPGQRVLLVGHGHSAANALGRLADREVEVTWAVRSAHLKPVVDVADDPLPERKRVVALANALAMRPPPWLRVERRAMIEAVGPGWARLTGGREVAFDVLAAFVGQRPDLSALTELGVEISPATEGAAGLARALSHVTDCLNVPAVPPAALASGEPGFHLVGARSYGRARTFLLQTGYTQIETVLDALGAR